MHGVTPGCVTCGAVREDVGVAKVTQLCSITLLQQTTLCNTRRGLEASHSAVVLYMTRRRTMLCSAGHRAMLCNITTLLLGCTVQRMQRPGSITQCRTVLQDTAPHNATLDHSVTHNSVSQSRARQRSAVLLHTGPHKWLHNTTFSAAFSLGEMCRWKNPELWPSRSQHPLPP